MGDMLHKFSRTIRYGAGNGGLVLVAFDRRNFDMMSGNVLQTNKFFSYRHTSTDSCRVDVTLRLT